MRTEEEISRLTHKGVVTSVTFSPDGQYAVSGSWDGTVQVWVWDLITKSCERLPCNFTRREWEMYFEDEPYRATCPSILIDADVQAYLKLLPKQIVAGGIGSLGVLDIYLFVWRIKKKKGKNDYLYRISTGQK